MLSPDRKNVYGGSDGHTYTEQDLTSRIGKGTWLLCMWSPAEGWYLVGTKVGKLLWLAPLTQKTSHREEEMRVQPKVSPDVDQESLDEFYR